MGNQLAGFSDSPDKKKNDHAGENARIRFCCTEMQGWRGSMEDSHIADLDIGDGNSLFAVFDGHDGPRAAGFASIYMRQLFDTASYCVQPFTRGAKRCILSSGANQYLDVLDVLVENQAETCAALSETDTGSDLLDFLQALID